MKHVQTVNLPPRALFNRLMHSVQADIRQHTALTPPGSRLQGFEYTKPLGQTQSRIRISVVVPGQTYAYTAMAGGATYAVSYQLVPTADGQTQVTYTESTQFADRIRQLNATVVGVLLGRGRKRRVSQLLHAIEATN